MTSPDKNQTIIFTDGACKGNPGRGGWAAVFYQNGERKIISGNDRFTTSNRMELTAAIKGLEAVPTNHDVVVYSDSRYLINTMTRGWNRNANQDLWEQLDRLKESRNVTWKWVRGHRGTPGNEIADRVASMEAGLFQTRDDSGTKRGPGSSPGRPKPRGKRPLGKKRLQSNNRRPRRSPA